MAHYVLRKGRYLSLEESYRENGKVRKRILKYFGTRRPSDPQARYDQMLDTAERKAEAVDAMQREKFGETASERRAREDGEAKFSPKDFLAETVEVKDDAADDDAKDGEEGGGDDNDEGGVEGHS